MQELKVSVFHHVSFRKRGREESDRRVLFYGDENSGEELTPSLLNPNPPINVPWIGLGLFLHRSRGS